MRPVNPARVDALATSMAGLGLQYPISVWLDGEAHVLVAGRHRLAAAEKLGWPTIEAVVVTMTDLERQLWEIDENLMRAELDPAQEAAHLARRRELWEQRETGNATCTTSLAGKPEPAVPVSGDKPEPAVPVSSDKPEPAVPVSGADVGKPEPAVPVSKGGRGNREFASETAESIGRSKQHINRVLRRAENIAPDALRDVAGTSLAKGVELDALTKLTADQQRDLAARAKAGEQVTARGLFDVDRNEISNRQFLRLRDAWGEAYPQTKERFLKMIGVRV